MTLSSGDDATDLPGGRPRSRLGWVLSVVGVVAVAFWFVRNGIALDHPAWVWAVGAVALAAWALRQGLRDRRGALVTACVMVVVGSLGVVPTDALLLVPVIVGIVALQASTTVPVWSGVVAALVALVEIAVGATVAHVAPTFVLGTAAGLVLGVLIGFSRRQVRLAADQARRSARDQQRAALLADRSRAARDIHDVLAHSLGGLVLQLDAVEALLEAGRVDEATRRAADARTLAADGLAEARRAVHALREDTGAIGVTPDRPTAPTAPSVPEPTRASRPDLPALVAAHRSFGGQVDTRGDLSLADLDAAHRDAVLAATREALSNARRHAPGRPVSLSVVRDGDAVDVVVANPLTAGGHGLVGMRERFAELDAGAGIEAGRCEDEFVVAMHVPVADARVDADGA